VPHNIPEHEQGLTDMKNVIAPHQILNLSVSESELAPTTIIQTKKKKKKKIYKINVSVGKSKL